MDGLFPSTILRRKGHETEGVGGSLTGRYTVKASVGLVCLNEGDDTGRDRLDRTKGSSKRL